MTRILLLILVVAGGYGIANLLIRNGVFLPVKFETREAGPLIFLGKDHVGPYHQILSSLEEVERFAASTSLPCDRSFGEFLDDPNVVEAARLKSFVGCVQSLTPAINLPHGVRVSLRPKRKYVVGTFHGSPALGPYKVYGKAHRFMTDQGLRMAGPVIEIYQREKEGEGMITFYYFPVH